MENLVSQPIKYLRLPMGRVIKITTQNGNTVRVRVEGTAAGGYGEALLVTVLEAPLTYNGQTRLVAAQVPADLDRRDITQGHIITWKTDTLTAGVVVMLGRNALKVADAQIE